MLVASNGSYLVIIVWILLIYQVWFVLNKTHHFSLYINVSDTLLLCPSSGLRMRISSVFWNHCSLHGVIGDDLWSNVLFQPDIELIRLLVASNGCYLVINVWTKETRIHNPDEGYSNKVSETLIYNEKWCVLFKTNQTW